MHYIWQLTTNIEGILHDIVLKKRACVNAREDKLIDEESIIKFIDEILLQKGKTFLLGSSKVIYCIGHSKLMKLLSKQLKGSYEEINNGIAVEQALLQKQISILFKQEHFIIHDASTNHIYFQLCLNSTERDQFYPFYKFNFPKLIKDIKEMYFDTNVFHWQAIPSLSTVS
ncbi:hypothetical protein RFI_00212 [Reticulomyxa filosa]|uniref:Uncharacterized protein n=1 Tax=Reticulomyxa filosa TaxID=46433 RepID=X6PFM2_RETFI|nr:hypothetical protein RFI_00212 [Reticulomyxa filosa]|eukprot:ETO36849.1 hypothetical protein RFI_00212 [Reticulomyxa filosa]